MNRLIVVAGLGGALLTAACTTGGTIDGHRITGTAEAPQPAQHVLPSVFEDAPDAVRNVWRRYLGDAKGRYAVLALDRRAPGAAGWVYCIGPRCVQLEHGFDAFKEVGYKHRALKICRRDVRNHHPGVRADCAIFAIKDKIVWKGPLPWNTSNHEKSPQPASAAPERQDGQQRTFSLSWLGSTDIHRGTFTLQQGARSGRIFNTVEGRECEGEFRFTGGLTGEWEFDCGNGWLVASGEFTANGTAGGGSRGTGVDNHGRMLEFVVDPARN